MALTATNLILVSAFPSIDTELFDYIEGKNLIYMNGSCIVWVIS